MAYDRVLDALGESTRRQIFELLRVGPRSVGEIAQQLPVSRPAVSQHLRVLKDAGLVEDRREGTRRVYAIRPAGLDETRAWFEDMWNGALAAFKEAAELDRGEAPRRRRRR